MRRALSVYNILGYKADEVALSPEWASLLGTPELKGSWIIWGVSGNGKTRFALQLARELARFGKVLYDSIEEGLSKSLRKAVQDVNFTDVGTNIAFLDKEPIDELIKRLARRQSAQIVIIDSLQYTGINYQDYKALRKRFPQKLFIWISHAEGKEPAGATAKSVRYDAFIKIRVEGYRAFAVSRYGGGEYMDVWREGALSYWNN